MFGYLYAIGIRIAQFVRDLYGKQELILGPSFVKLEIENLKNHDERIAEKREVLSWDPLLEATLQDYDKNLAQLYANIESEIRYHSEEFKANGTSMPYERTMHHRHGFLIQKKLLSEKVKKEYIEKAREVDKAVTFALSTLIPTCSLGIISEYVIGNHADIERIGEDIFKLCSGSTELKDND